MDRAQNSQTWTVTKRRKFKKDSRVRLTVDEKDIPCAQQNENQDHIYLTPDTKGIKRIKWKKEKLKFYIGTKKSSNLKLQADSGDQFRDIKHALVKLIKCLRKSGLCFEHSPVQDDSQQDTYKMDNDEEEKVEQKRGSKRTKEEEKQMDVAKLDGIHRRNEQKDNQVVPNHDKEYEVPVFRNDAHMSCLVDQITSGDERRTWVAKKRTGIFSLPISKTRTLFLKSKKVTIMDGTKVKMEIDLSSPTCLDLDKDCSVIVKTGNKTHKFSMEKTLYDDFKAAVEMTRQSNKTSTSVVEKMESNPTYIDKMSEDTFEDVVQREEGNQLVTVPSTVYDRKVWTFDRLLNDIDFMELPFEVDAVLQVDGISLQFFGDSTQNEERKDNVGQPLIKYIPPVNTSVVGKGGVDVAMETGNDVATLEKKLVDYQGDLTLPYREERKPVGDRARSDDDVGGTEGKSEETEDEEVVTESNDWMKPENDVPETKEPLIESENGAIEKTGEAWKLDGAIKSKDKAIENKVNKPNAKDQLKEPENDVSNFDDKIDTQAGRRVKFNAKDNIVEPKENVEKRKYDAADPRDRVIKPELLHPIIGLSDTRAKIDIPFSNSGNDIRKNIHTANEHIGKELEQIAVFKKEKGGLIKQNTSKTKQQSETKVSSKKSPNKRKSTPIRFQNVKETSKVRSKKNVSSGEVERLLTNARKGLIEKTMSAEDDLELKQGQLQKGRKKNKYQIVKEKISKLGDFCVKTLKEKPKMLLKCFQKMSANFGKYFKRTNVEVKTAKVAKHMTTEVCENEKPFVPVAPLQIVKNGRESSMSTTTLFATTFCFLIKPVSGENILLELETSEWSIPILLTTAIVFPSVIWLAQAVRRRLQDWEGGHVIDQNQDNGIYLSRRIIPIEPPDERYSLGVEETQIPAHDNQLLLISQ